MPGLKKLNEYVHVLDQKLYEETPKAVFAAIAVSALTCGSDQLFEASERIKVEWWTLYINGIVPQRPPFPRPNDEDYDRRYAAESEYAQSLEEAD